jgi:hypothetical protein
MHLNSLATVMRFETLQEVAKQTDRKFMAVYYSDVKDQLSEWIRDANTEMRLSRGLRVTGFVVNTAAEMNAVREALGGVQLPVMYAQDIAQVAVQGNQTPLQAYALKWWGAEQARIAALDPNSVKALITGPAGLIGDLVISPALVGYRLADLFNAKYWAIIQSQA